VHTALWRLYRLRIRGGLRSLGRKLKSVRGAALVVFTLLALGLMIGPNLVMAFKLNHEGIMGASADGFREAVPVVMLLYVLLSVATSLGERAIYFSPSDVDFLFPAPFSRREVLLYKILGNVMAAISVAVFFPPALIMHIRSLSAAAVGFFLAFLMVNSLTMCAQLVAQSVTERAFTRARKAIVGAVIVAAAVALGQAASRGFDGPWQQTLVEARHSPVAEAILAPFTVFAKIIAAERLVPDALGWAALGAVLVVGVYALAIRPMAMACAQTLVPTMTVTLLDWLVFAAVASLVPAAAARLFVAGMFALPFNWILFGTEDFLFLLYPAAPMATGSDGFLKMGRAMLFMLAKVLMVTVCGVVAAIPAGVVYFLTESVPAACLVAWLALLLPSLGILFVAAWAFRRYDVSAGVSE